jgi:hypothetical protein
MFGRGTHVAESDFLALEVFGAGDAAIGHGYQRCEVIRPREADWKE